MTLDLAKVSPQLRRMSQQLVDRQEQTRLRLEQARQTLASWSDRWTELRDLAEQREGGQRLASPREPLNLALPLPAIPVNHRILATDGSQIEPDRHGAAEYYLINIGWVSLRYGDRPAAQLETEPTLAYEPENLFIMDDQHRRRVPVQGSHLAAKRAVRELARAAELASEVSSFKPALEQSEGFQVSSSTEDLPGLILQDGTLLLWVLEERPEDFLRQTFLDPYVKAMKQCYESGWALASYISRPRGTEGSALLKAATCRGEFDSCGACRTGVPRPAGPGDVNLRTTGWCALDGMHDRLLFDHLQPGERSAVFAVTLHEKLERYYEGQRIHFFVLNGGSELGRVEVPEWVAADSAMLDLVHALVYDQCQRGQGYPVALTRAHEQAVVRGADRQSMRALMESMFAQQGLYAAVSEKASAKRLRAV